MGYIPPIQLIQKQMELMREKQNEELEKYIYEAVCKYDIKVDKEELIKALNYDRGQYQKGYEDAREKYEKALEKACSELEKWDIKNVDNIQVTKEEWKEWCMKDE